MDCGTVVGSVIGLDDLPMTVTGSSDIIISSTGTTAYPPVEGDWRWITPAIVHWRPAAYWAPGTVVGLHSDLRGLQVGEAQGAEELRQHLGGVPVGPGDQRRLVGGRPQLRLGGEVQSLLTGRAVGEHRPDPVEEPPVEEPPLEAPPVEEPPVEDDDEDEDEDVLEETPEFLQDAPEHDRLWFEQKPPRDFDFGE